MRDLNTMLHHQSIREEREAVYAELVNELKQIPVGDLVWLEDFRIRANEKIRTVFGEGHRFLREMNSLLDDLNRQAAGASRSISTN